MMGIDISAFVRMILLSLLLGALLGGMLEIVRFIFGFCFPKTIDATGQSDRWTLGVVALRDVIFFLISGAAFAVFIYYANNGNIRLFAILGTLVGFFAFYFTVGRFIRRIFGFLIHICHKLVSLLAYPLKWGLGKCLVYIKSKNKTPIRKRNNVTCEDVNEPGYKK